MDETLTTIPSDAESNSSQYQQFRLDVSINDLPYVLEGSIPEQPNKFELIVSLPEDKWQEIRPQVNAAAEDNSWFRSQYSSLQQALRLGDGRVGSVWVSQEPAPDGAPSISVSRIQTDNRYLPEDSDYHNASGVGSFILDSLCAIADARGWRIYLTPLERDGRLAGDDLNDWYRRRGFMFNFEASEELEHLYNRHGAEMMRLPKELDLAQPIAAIMG